MPTDYSAPQLRVLAKNANTNSKSHHLLSLAAAPDGVERIAVGVTQPLFYQQRSARLHHRDGWAPSITTPPMGKDGGRDRDRTCDPYHVKVVLSR